MIRDYNPRKREEEVKDALEMWRTAAMGLLLWVTLIAALRALDTYVNCGYIFWVENSTTLPACVRFLQ